MSTKTQIGEGIDCLNFAFIDLAPTQIGLNVVSFFVLPGGTLVNQGTTSLGAFLDGFGNGVIPVDDDGGTVPVTHMTGSIPGAGADSIVLATGQFAGATGTARVSGAVNPNGDGLANPAFNC